MANVLTSPNMNLPVPQVGADPGPDWANNINSCLSIIDQHNHTPGQGVQITPAGLNINSDLSFLANNATDLRTVRFFSQSAPITALSPDLDCLYVAGVDLYYNDGAGNQIRLTQSGSIVGTSGSITGLTAPASASYVSATGTFVWQQAASTAANMDAATLIIRYPGSYPTVSGNYIAIQAPSTLATGYSLTLPSALPSSASLLQIDTSGNISYSTSSSLVPSGILTYYSGSSVPVGYLEANGQAVSRTTYGNLFAAIGTTYGSGDGSTTFNVPNNLNPFYMGGANSIPSYVQSYWQMGQSSGNEPNYASSGSVYNLMQSGTVPSASGKVSPIGSRGPYAGANFFRVLLGSSSTTAYDVPNFVIGFWVNSTATSQILASKYDGTNGWFFGIDGSGNIQMEFTASSAGEVVLTSSGITVNDGNWHLVYFALLASSGSNGAVIFIDNVMRASTSGFTYPKAAADFFVGVNSHDTTIDPATGSLLTLIEFWDSVPASLSAFETLISQRWNSGSGQNYTADIQQLVLIKT